MILEGYYRINSPKIVHEILDGEAVIINMDLGHYYSTDQAGAVIWECLCNVSDRNEVVGAVERRYTGSREQIEGAVDEFLAQLQREDLITSVPAEEKLATGGECGGNRGEDAGRSAFVPPVLTKYTDMEYLLLLDPIHEVDESGWPHATSPEKQP